MIAISAGGRPRDSRRRASAATRSALPLLNVLGSKLNAAGENSSAATETSARTLRVLMLLPSLLFGCAYVHPG